ncbi:MAG: LysR family transcriptional regulator [Betaproteobacteria bacterium]|nr:LysR family transcriptional regulator [Betaproteobacteria bacterium]
MSVREKRQVPPTLKAGIAAKQFLEITYPTHDLLKGIEAVGPDQGRPVVVIGERGLGKSHLMAVLYHAVTDPASTSAWLNAWAITLAEPGIGTRSTRLTFAGQVLLNDVRRLFTFLDQARDNVRAAASGHRGILRIAVSDGVVPQRFSSLLARCREQEPDIEIRLFEVPLSQQVRGLRDGFYDIGFARLGEVGEGIEVTPIWTDLLVAVVPSRHPLLAHKRVALRDVVNYPLILAHPQASEGWYRQIERILRTVDVPPVIAEYVGSHDLLFALIAAGYGVGFACESQLVHIDHADVLARPLEGESAIVTTYLLRPDSNPSPHVKRFIDRISANRAP